MRAGSSPLSKLLPHPDAFALEVMCKADLYEQ